MSTEESITQTHQDFADHCFKRDTRDHVATITLNNGLFRNIELKNADGSFVCSFGVQTWPGYLCFYGDMGCYVFHRIDDMFLRWRHGD